MNFADARSAVMAEPVLETTAQVHAAAVFVEYDRAPEAKYPVAVGAAKDQAVHSLRTALHGDRQDSAEARASKGLS
jgi:acetyl esterase/lipase